MLSQMKQSLPADNPRNYPAEIIEELEALLLSGRPCVPDPKRKHFYDLQNDRRTFFIYISPKTARLTLLGTWLHAMPIPEFADCANAGD
jgi:hypothetical protein